MAERPQGFARRMMAQRLMSDARDDPFSDSRFFSGRVRPSMQDMAEPTRFSDMAMPAYATGATASLFAPGAGVTDIMGFAPDPAQPGEFLPSFGQNITQGNFLDAGLQALGGAGDVMMAGGTVIPPLVGVGAALKAPRAARVASSSAPALLPAIRGGGKIFKGDVGETHLDVLDAIEDKQLASRLLSDADNRGFVTEKGKFLSRDRAVDYALQNDLLDPDFASYYKPDQYSELIADHLKKPKPVDPNQQMGDALAQAQARYFETGQFEPPTAENPVSVVLPTETEPGIIAFHGSGADFDEFRLEMIGTGEGAQAYGYGLYFTDSEDIAKFYRNSVGGANVLKTAQNIKIEVPSGGTETAANFTGFRNKFAEFYGEDAALFADRYLGQFTIDPDAPQDVLIERAKVLMANVKESDRIPENAEEIVSKITLPERGKIYKVGLSPKPDELLDFDASFSEQSKDVQEKLIKAGYELDPRTSGSGNMIIESIMSDIAKARLAGRDETLKNINARLSELAKEMDKYSSGYRNFNDPRGQVLADEYDALLVERENLPTMTMSEARKLASQELAKAGIPGIKYRAAGSRGASTSDEAAERNYVIFDDRAVKILEKYGIAGPVLVTGGAVAATQRGGDEEGSIFPDA